MICACFVPRIAYFATTMTVICKKKLFYCMHYTGEVEFKNCESNCFRFITNLRKDNFLYKHETQLIEITFF